MEEFLFKYYDKKRLLAIKDKTIRKTKEFQILKAKLGKKKEKKQEKDDEGSWEIVDEDGEKEVESDEGNI